MTNVRLNKIVHVQSSASNVSARLINHVAKQSLCEQGAASHQANGALNISIMSFSTEHNIGHSCCSRLTADPQNICQCCL